MEDSPDSRELICHLLQSAGLQVETADNGKDGLEKALKHKPDLLLLDLEMPVLNGFGVIKQLRASAYNKPIVAITAHNTLQDRDRCQDAGFDGLISKPFNQEGLVRVLKEHLSNI
ncbi:MAG: response regulator [Bdellovibrionota bacterium]